MAVTGEHTDKVIDLVARETERRDGDDIVVEPEPAPAPRFRRHRRALLAGAMALALVAAATGIALATRHDSATKSLRAAQQVPRHAATPPARAGGKHAVTRTPHAPAKHIAPPVFAPPAATHTTTPVSAASPPPSPPPSTPVAEPVSVLVWQASPSSPTIPAGGHAVLNISVSNPTAGTVTLPVPLSCAPALQKPHGTPIGGGICPQMTQLMSGHDQLTQPYTLYATDSGDASGGALAPGSYVVKVEGVFSVKVTVTPRA